MIGSKVEEGDRSPLLFNGGRIMAQDSNDLFYAIKEYVAIILENHNTSDVMSAHLCYTARSLN